MYLSNGNIFIILIIIFSLIIIITIISIIECSSYKKTYYKINSLKKIDKTRIIYISDFHDKKYKNEDSIISYINNVNPNYIVLGGDFVEYSTISRLYKSASFDNALLFIKKLMQKLQNSHLDTNSNFKGIFFSYGNHEHRLSKYDNESFESFTKKLIELGVNILDNDIYLSDNISITGISLHDGYYGKFNLNKHIEYTKIQDLIKRLDKDKFNICLFHKPDYAEDFIDYGYDLVVSGHNHGGLIRFPFIGSVFSPDLKLLPKYDYGYIMYKSGHIIISSGFGEHFLKIRVNNKPEIVIIDIN